MVSQLQDESYNRFGHSSPNLRDNNTYCDYSQKMRGNTSRSILTEYFILNEHINQSVVNIYVSLEDKSFPTFSAIAFTDSETISTSCKCLGLECNYRPLSCQRFKFIQYIETLFFGQSFPSSWDVLTEIENSDCS